MNSRSLRGYVVLLACAIPFVCCAQHRAFYIDCSLTQNGSGAINSPWNDIASINGVTFQPGDTISLKRGTTCHGVLAPLGSGSSGHAIRLTAYGVGARPRIIADANAEEALHLFNQQYWDIDSLDISGGSTYGIFISGDDGILHHIHLTNLLVHDVIGGKMKHKESGLVSISPSSAKAHFDDVVVDGVNAWHTNQWVGILVGGGDLGFPPESDWNTNVVIRNSTVHEVQGDGIVLFRVRHGLIDTSVAWNIGMQDTQTIGTPNAIWTWMCDDCTVSHSEAYLTDSPGVDGGSFDIDYGNTKNSVLYSYGHDTQGYCVAIFAAGFVTHDSVVRGNLCINNGRSPRMALYQGAIFIWTWNGGSIDGLTIEKNSIYWNPLENTPAVLNRGRVNARTASFRDNTIYSTSPRIIESNTAMSLSGDAYSYFGRRSPAWNYGGHDYASLADLQTQVKQESGATITRLPLKNWSQVFVEHDTSSLYALQCILPVTFDANGLLDDRALQQLVVLKSFAQQYAPQGLKVSVVLAGADAKLFASEAFRNAFTDLGLSEIDVKQKAMASDAITINLSRSDGKAIDHWEGETGPVQLGLALRKILGEPIYAQMATK
ncbi:MAG TPA: hypothetical protein VMD97_11995 [Candidatus Aquilonibacter sp.]|nr:hypothetical protein [Candidatus Aquilonibacter sp.]